MFILDLTSKCSDPGLANILSMVKKVLSLIQLIGPIMAIVGLTIVFIKLMSSPDDKKLKTAIRNWIIAFFMLFFMPILINVFMKLFDNSFEISACWNYADKASTTGQKSTYKEDIREKNKTHLSDYDYESSTGKDDDNSNGNSSTGNNSNSTISSRIFIGDSRTVGMQGAVGSNNDTWSCEVSKGLPWMKQVGFPNIESKIGNNTAIIILMGVNDLRNASQYASYINDLASKYSTAHFYFVSVNPTSGSRSDLNSSIDSFNNTIKSELNSSVRYIDTNKYLVENGFTAQDGLHYDNSTYNKIYNYIIENI